jgi:hypothetical protein
MLVTVNVVHSSPILVTLMMEALRSSETSVFTNTPWRTIPEDDIPQVTAVKTSNLTQIGLLLQPWMTDDDCGVTEC